MAVGHRPILKIELAAPASPANVQEVARLCVEMLAAMVPPVDPTSGSVTLVVSNEDLRAELRARDGTGTRAVRRITGVVKSPARQRASGEGANVIDVLSHRVGGLIRTGATFKVGNDVIATCDDVFAAKLAKAEARTDAPHDVVSGTTSVISPVLRMGRNTEDGTLSARLRFDDGWHDVEVSEETSSLFWKAAATSDCCEAVWLMVLRSS
jgi:hypothetical protein